MENIPKLLGDLPLFSGISPAELQTVAQQSRLVRFWNGDLLYDVTHLSTELYLLVEGFVRINHALDRGRESTVLLAGPGEYFGEGFLEPEPHTQRPVRWHQVRALTPVLALTMPQAAFARLITTSSRFALAHLNVVSRRLSFTQELQAQVLTAPAPGRIAYLLALIATTYGRPHALGQILPFKLPQDTIANMAGTTRETATKAVAQLHQRGLLVWSSHTRTLIVRGKALSLIETPPLRTVRAS